MREALLGLLTEFQEKILSLNDNLVHRDAYLTDLPNKIKVVIGMRRTGKTYFLYQQVKSLTQKGIPLERFLFLNFEDDRLSPLTQKKLAALADTFYEIYPENYDQKCYLIFDEIQNVEDWALVVRRLLDSKNVDIYLSGSSAKLLSKEIATSLRGRSLATEMWPYSFSEYLSACHIKLEETLKQSKKAMDIKRNIMHTYLDKGGFPETIPANEADHQRLLQEYVDLVIYRDIIERHNITNITLVKYLIKTLLKNPATLFSVNKFYHDIKSQGMITSKNTIYDYLDHIEDAYVAFTVPIYAESLRKVQTNPKKIYAVDTGLANMYTFNANRNIGHLFENLVYLDLRRQGCEIYYYLTEERYEVDFLVRTRMGEVKLLQVAYNTNDQETYDREVRALEKAEKELGVKGEIVTVNSYLAEY